jgi:hypothetical protein
MAHRTNAQLRQIAERLVDPIRFDEGCSVLEVAERLVAAGLRVSFVVHADVDGARKMPDIFVEHPESGIKFHCEVSVMYSAKTQVDQSRLVDQISGSLPSMTKNLSLSQDTFCGRLAMRRPKDSLVVSAGK